MAAAPPPEAPAAAPPLRRQRLAAALLPALLVAAALWPALLWLVHQRDPEAAVRLQLQVRHWLGQAALWLGAAALLAALVWPPVPAGLWLWLDGLRRRLSTDRGPLFRALGELQHFASAARHLEVGRQALQLREHGLALAHLRAALALEPEVASAQHLWGLLAFRLGDLPAAAAAFAAAERLDPGHAFGDALLHLGRTALLLGDPARALQLLQEHARRHGGGAKSHYWLGEAALAAGDRAAARAAFAAAATRPAQRETAEARWFRARARVRRWRLGGAP